MDKLSPEAEALTRAGRAALKPTDDDRKRVLLALGARLGDLGKADPSGDAAGDVPAPRLPRAPGWPALTAVVAGLALGGGVLVQVLRTPVAPAVVSPPATATALPPPASASHGVSDGAPASPASGEVTARPSETAVATSTEPRSGATRARSPHDAGDTLAQEVAILSRAESALHAGRFAEALGLLAEHEQKFPRGVLTQERIAARARSLCGLGRVEAARVELARLAPGSLLEGRAKEACGVQR